MSSSDPAKAPIRAVSIRHRAGDIDRQVGARIRERRIMMGLTQQQMAERVGVTYQQAHKYEKGFNRVSAGRLYAFAQALDVEINFFFEGMETGQTVEPAPHQRLMLELARSFTSIRSRQHQEALGQLARALATAGPVIGVGVDEGSLAAA
jgi:transcriptional regulator with XRE-family HTH domain